MEKRRAAPEIRFDGFFDDWEQRALGDFGKTQSGIGFPDAEQGGTEGIPFFKVSDMNNVGNEHEMVNSNNYVNYIQLKRKKWKPIETVPAVMFAKVGAAIMLNRKRLVRTPFLMDNNTMAYVFDESWDVYFGKTLFETINLQRFAQVGALPSYNGSDIENIEVSVPNKEEQTNIGNFFRQLDHTIALHQEKLSKLQRIKKAFLQLMFPKNGETEPRLRFANFVSEWEQRKLGEISEKVMEKNKKNEFSETLTNSAEFGIINQRDFFDKDISNKRNLDSYYVVREDDFVYNPRISSLAPVGPIKRNKLGRTGVMSPLYYVFRAHDIDKTYLEYYFSATGWHKFMKLNGDSGARADRFTIKDSMFREMPIPYPCIEEQKKIGQFFANLDHTIALHQTKLDKLQSLKKAYLQKMFI